VDNTIIEAKFNGIDVIGDSPILRRNRYCVRTPTRCTWRISSRRTARVQSQPFLDNNNFGNSPVSSKSSASVARSAP